MPYNNKDHLLLFRKNELLTNCLPALAETKPPISSHIFMSILPTEANRSTSSSSPTLLQNPNFNHGLPQASEELLDFPLSDPTDTQTLGPVQISGSQSVSHLSTGNSGSVSSTSTGSGGSSKKVSEARTSNGRKSWHRQNQTMSGNLGGGGISSQFSSTQSAARKNQTMNGNHLLNFQYDPISRPQPRIPPPRKQQKIKPYNKDLFIQANYKFVVLDSGNDELESMDPDKMLQWDNVVCVRYSTPHPVHCPICLESPLCPQITSCGHIFCFPCILRYLLMGEEDHKGDSWKKCPLCFMMVSSKDLYTINIENVKQHHIGDNIQFTLLSRAKDSLIPSQKNQLGMDTTACASVDLCDSFSKFTMASDAELSVREATSELNGWLARAESGLVDDLEQLPYVCAAMEQLEQRKKVWSDLQTLNDKPPSRNHGTSCSNVKTCKYANKIDTHVFAPNGNADVTDSKVRSGNASLSPSTSHKYESKWSEGPSPEKLYGEECFAQTTDVRETFEAEESLLSSSYDEHKCLQKGSRFVKENESYTFYQAIDGQHLILHPLNMKCLLHYYGSYDSLPPRIGGKILQLETVTQSDTMRRRYRYLSHFSLTTTFQLCEIDLSETLPPDALSPFLDEIKKRENQRKRLAKKEHKEKIKAEADVLQAIPISSSFGRSSLGVDSMFSMDDFEALGSSPVSSSSPPIVGERKRFSEVTRLGFAAGIDSPSFTAGESADASSNKEARSEASVPTGQRSDVTLSFANIISTAKSTANGAEIAKMNGLGKKGKKPSRVLLSTAGGRRY
ncbi:zinc finger protein [Macleaya cordata]|uniref:Zinc finger protein n=1 Tax=Macleaya cordata TaxID=56857 RepID=A0A200QGV1_MACCD|nr:zinc finger protein [Macleaya cordata]